ncbi:hypothetical protein O6H91_03G077500 [Diphasiastrum complanatum]|uniref:Uncharacterized protein n=1 Tax=Diphasiastrum complanatum TaxID=34168 RepID=A0ACC2E7R0_DIPCM|nr:hypothetical protein O6H91_03G077500 [Diphasiastrum complanatum]
MDSCNRGGEAASLPPLIDFGEDDTCFHQHVQGNTSWSQSLIDALPSIGSEKVNQTEINKMPEFFFEPSSVNLSFTDKVPSANPFETSSELIGAEQPGTFSEFSSALKYQDFSYSTSVHGQDSHIVTEPPDLLTGSASLDSLFFTPSSSLSPQAAIETSDWSNFLDSSSTQNPFENLFETRSLKAQCSKSGSLNDFNAFAAADPSQKKSLTVGVQPEPDNNCVNVERENYRPNVISFSDAQLDTEYLAPTTDEDSLSPDNLSTCSPNSDSSMSVQTSTTQPYAAGELPMNSGQTTNGSTTEGSYNLGSLSGNGDIMVLKKWNSSPILHESEKHGEMQGSAYVNEELTEAVVKKGQSSGRGSLRWSSVKMENVFPEEFVGAGGGKGIFRAPYRGAVHPLRPVSLELRPHPLGDQRTDGTKVLICTDEAVWAGCDFGLKVWNIDSATSEGSDGHGNKPGDKDAAAFIVLTADGTSTQSLATDVTDRFILSGHKDGRVRAWRTDMCSRSQESEESNSAVLMWQAHRNPVLALVVTSYGSENGALRAWSLDVIAAMHLSSSDCNRPTTLIAPEYIDLKVRGIAAGASSLVNTDVRFLLSEHANGRVWSGGSTCLSLWDARTRDVLKVFGPNGHPEFLNSDFVPLRDVSWEADVKLNYAKVSKKEKNSGSLNFFQRSRNAVMGAADAVRRAAVGGQGVDDSKKLEALATAVDGTVWGGFANGLLMQWDGQGNRLQDMQMTSVAVKCICIVGTRIWVGYADGRVQVIAMDSGKLLGGWFAHGSGVMQMARGGNYIFTLAAHGGIRGWQIASPSPIDVVLQSELSSRADSYTERQQLHVLAATWNVSEEKASQRSLQMWLSEPASKASIVFVGLQEMEMGAGAIAMAAAKETVGFGLQEKGTANAQWWLENIAHVIGEGQEFERVGYRQLAGIFIGVWVRRKLLSYLGEVDTSAVACGFGRALGNKGAVGVRMQLYRRTFCFVSSHFAAHMDAIVRRNADFEHVYNRMSFGRSLGAVGAAATAVAAGVSNAVQILRGSNVRRTTSGLEAQDIYSEKDSSSIFTDSEPAGENVSPELSEADLLVWVGDLNYRIDELSYEEAVNLISQERWKTLLGKDQLRTEMTAGRVFQGMREGAINFPPSYKFDKGYQYVQGYDSSEKRRVPAWCDRVLFRDSFSGTESRKGSELSHPVMASVIGYNSCMEVADSDHKPIWCMLNIDLAAVDEAARRRQLGEVMCKNVQIRNFFGQLDTVPEIVVNTEKIILEDGTHPVLKVSNESRHHLTTFSVHCEGNPNLRKDSQRMLAEGFIGGYGFPGWLQVAPASGIIHPNQSLEINVVQVMEDHIEAMHEHLWDVHEKDEVTLLVITVRGQYSRLSKQFHVTVYRCPSRDHRPDREPNVYLQRSEGMGSRWGSQDARTFSA